jgi:ubiquinone/menaquinone biosynthesis C-methylase UbiE
MGRSTQTETIRNRYSRIAGLYDLFEAPMERAFAGWRQQLLTGVEGRVLEVGVGTGKNLPYYPTGAQVKAIDFSPQMIERARWRIEREGLTNIELREMDARRLEFPGDAFDTIVSTCVFCSVPLPLYIYGANINRRTLENLRAAGFSRIEEENLWSDIMKRIVARP